MLQQTSETRSTTSTVTFVARFRLGADCPELPAGTYTVHTYEDVYRGAFEPVYVTTCVELVAKAAGQTSSYIVKSQDLMAALSQDASGLNLMRGLSENPDRGRL